MKRLHLLEIHDHDWCPHAIRNGVTDYLQFVLTLSKPYAAIAPKLSAALLRAGTSQILDLCSGAGGPWIWLRPMLAEQGAHPSVCLSDKFPNAEAFERSHRSDHTITFHPRSVDATQVPADLPGFRTMFTAFHHFKPEQARDILSDAIRQGRGIGIFEATHRGGISILLMLLVPVIVLLATPFIRPFRWSRLFWTYIIPLIPLVTAFDGFVSCLRTYSAPELRELVASLGVNNYHWEIGEMTTKSVPYPMPYLVGVPTTSLPPSVPKSNGNS